MRHGSKFQWYFFIYISSQIGKMNLLNTSAAYHLQSCSSKLVANGFREVSHICVLVQLSSSLTTTVARLFLIGFFSATKTLKIARALLIAILSSLLPLLPFGCLIVL